MPQLGSRNHTRNHGKPLKNLVFLIISGYSGGPNEDYLRIKIPAQMMQIGPPLRGPDPPYAVGEDFHRIRDSQTLRKSDPPYADYHPTGYALFTDP